jgi:disulfide bond formation protein DsbB
MRIVIRVPQVLVAVAVLALGAVGIGLVSQHVFDMQPCAWCVFQRLLYLLIAVFALAAAFSAGLKRRVTAGLALLVALCGIASALWQQLYAVNEFSCDLSLAERIVSGLHLDRIAPNIFIAYASCGDAAVNVLGVPYAIWSCVLFVLLALLLAWTLRTSMRPAGARG